MCSPDVKVLDDPSFDDSEKTGAIICTIVIFRIHKDGMTVAVKFPTEIILGHYAVHKAISISDGDHGVAN
jgi:hypothetical protein